MFTIGKIWCQGTTARFVYLTNFNTQSFQIYKNAGIQHDRQIMPLGSSWLAFWTNYRPVKIYYLSTRHVGETRTKIWNGFSIQVILMLWTLRFWHKFNILRKIHINIMKVTFIGRPNYKTKRTKRKRIFSSFFCRFLGNSAHSKNNSR